MNSKHRHAHPGRQRGAAALMLAAVMVIFCATLAGSFYFGKGTSSATSYDQVESLRWAQEAVTGFTVAHGRLPCAASVRNGAENCAPGTGKGWLPAASIEQFAQAPSARGRMQVRYLVYRGIDDGADPDLAVAGNAFQPSLADGSVPATYPEIVSSVDLCAQLRAASLPVAAARWSAGTGPSGATARADRANVSRAAGGGLVNVAYGLAVSPVGTAENQSNLNTDTSPHMESPDRRVDNTYRDMVRIVDFATLFDTLSCDMTTASLDGLAVAAAWTKDAAGLRTGTIEGSAKVVEIEAIIVSAAGIGVVGTGLDLQNASASALQATALVATNTPLLPLPPAAVAVASGTAGALTAAETISMAKFDLVKAIAGAAVESGNLVAYKVAEKKGIDSHVWADSDAILATADKGGIAP